MCKRISPTLTRCSHVTCYHYSIKHRFAAQLAESTHYLTLASLLVLVCIESSTTIYNKIEWLTTDGWAALGALFVQEKAQPLIYVDGTWCSLGDAWNVSSSFLIMVFAPFLPPSIRMQDSLIERYPIVAGQILRLGSHFTLPSPAQEHRAPPRRDSSFNPPILPSEAHHVCISHFRRSTV